MAKEITVQGNQSNWDVALQEYGSVEGLFLLLEDNPGLTVDSELTPGQKLIIKSPPINADVVGYYAKKTIKITTIDPAFPIPGADNNDDFNDDFNIE